MQGLYAFDECAHEAPVVLCLAVAQLSAVFEGQSNVTKAKHLNSSKKLVL